MPTVIGVLFLLAAVYLFFQKDDKLFALVIFSAIFQSSSVVALKEAGVEPFYLVASLFVLQSIYMGRLGFKKLHRFKGQTWMILFALIAIASAFTLPFVFAGIPVYEQHIGIDDGLFFRPSLQYTNTNLTHSLSLLLGVLVVLGASQKFGGVNVTKKAYTFTFYFLAGLIAIQFLCSFFGINFPYSLLQNHAGRVMQIVETGDMSSRYPGTFTESSTAGQVLAGFTAGFLAEKLKFGRSLIPVLIGLVTIFLVRSTGAMVVIVVIGVALLLSLPIFRFPWHINAVLLRRVSTLLLLTCVATACVVLSPLRDSMLAMTVNKQDTASFVNRVAADAYAIDLLIKTHGIGVGMGSNRPSSLIPSLLSTVGIVGLVVFLVAYFQLLSNAVPHLPDLRWAGIAYFLSLVTSGPDYETPWLWVLLAIVVHTSHSTMGESVSSNVPAKSIQEN